MMGVMESVEVLRAYLDESAGCVPPKVYGAMSTAVAVMETAYVHADVFGKLLNAVETEGSDGR